MIAALLAEGPSDKALLPILRWLLSCLTSADVRIEWVDSSSFGARATSLAEKVRLAQVVCRCDILFVHRDADKQPPIWRYNEIREAVGDQAHVAVVPVRSTETWLLIDAAAIRAAAGRVSGVDDLGLPPLAKLEADKEPKATLREALRRAHGATGRRAQKFQVPTAINRLANLIEDWTPLRQLEAFRRLEEETRSVLNTFGFAPPAAEN